MRARHGHFSPPSKHPERRGTTADSAPTRGTIQKSRKPSHSKGFRMAHSGPAPVPPPKSVGAYGQEPSDTQSGHERGTKGAGGTDHTHHWVRIGPYLKCSGCGELRAADEDQR